MPRYKTHPNRAAALVEMEAIDLALGFPVPGVNVGKGPHAAVPAEYSPGAPGWTAHECSVLEHVDGETMIVLTPRAAALSVRDVPVKGKPVRLDFASTPETRPAKFDDFQNLKAEVFEVYVPQVAE